nr:exo-alpha-sialidase [Terriglobales bacterium]
MRNALFLAVLLVGAGLTGLMPQEALAVSVPKNVNISKTQGDEAETTVAVNRLNPAQLTVISNIEAGSGIFHAWSKDGGRTWRREIIADGDALGFACCDAQLASDDFGNIFLTYLSSDIFVKMALSTDGGATFQPLPFLDTLPAGLLPGPWRSLAAVGQLVGGDQPSISTGAGSVWVSWTSSNGTIQATGAPVTGLGQVGAFIASQGIPGANNAGDYGDTSVGPNGQVFVVYQNPTGGQGPSSVYGALDPDGLGPLGFQPATLIQKTNVGGFDFIP